MGLVLLPLMLFWFAALVYSLQVGYQLLAGHLFLPYGISFLFLLAVSVTMNVHAGLAKFKDKKEVWAFEIPMFFMTNKFIFLSFVLTILIHVFGNQFASNEYISAVLAIAMISFSFSALLGAYVSGNYIKKNNIATTY